MDSLLVTEGLWLIFLSMHPTTMGGSVTNVLLHGITGTPDGTLFAVGGTIDLPLPWQPGAVMTIRFEDQVHYRLDKGPESRRLSHGSFKNPVMVLMAQ